MKSVNELYQKILDFGIVSEETLQIVTSINGYNIDTLNDIIYAKTGYRDIEQFEESEEV